VTEMSPEWVMGPEQGESSGRILPLAFGQACFGMAFPPFLMKQLNRCDSIVTALFAGTGYTMRR
jgi:hypothetical protein